MPPAKLERRLEEGAVLAAASSSWWRGTDLSHGKKKQACIKGSLTAGSTGEGPRQGGQG